MAAGVIKSGALEMMGPVLAPLELRDLHQECEVFLEAAQREAADIRARAAGDARERVAAAMELAKGRGYEIGRAAGLAAGTESGRKQGYEKALIESREAFQIGAVKALTAMVDLQQAWEARHRQLFVEARQDVVALAVAIARRIVPSLPDIVQTMAVESCGTALEALGKAHDLTVRANPADIEALQKLADGTRWLDAGAKPEWVGDASVARGGVRLESAAGSVDATLQTQVDRISNEILEDWRERMTQQGLAEPVAP